MSDDTLNIDFGMIDFGKAQEFAQPAQGAYPFIIEDYKVSPPKNPDSKGKGLNVSLVLKFEDPTSVLTELGETEDFSGFKTFDNIWVHFDNPWAAKTFFEAVTGRDLSEGQLNITNVSDFIGERVGAVLELVPHWQDPKKTQVKVRPQSYYAV
jgi:hypothetical protein